MTEPIVLPEAAAAIIHRRWEMRDAADVALREAVQLVLATLNLPDTAQIRRLPDGRMVAVPSEAAIAE